MKTDSWLCCSQGRFATGRIFDVLGKVHDLGPSGAQISDPWAYSLVLALAGPACTSINQSRPERSLVVSNKGVVGCLRIWSNASTDAQLGTTVMGISAVLFHTAWTGAYESFDTNPLIGAGLAHEFSDPQIRPEPQLAASFFWELALSPEPQLAARVQVGVKNAGWSVVFTPASLNEVRTLVVVSEAELPVIRAFSGAYQWLNLAGFTINAELFESHFRFEGVGISCFWFSGSRFDSRSAEVPIQGLFKVTAASGASLNEVRTTSASLSLSFVPYAGLLSAFWAAHIGFVSIPAS